LKHKKKAKKHAVKAPLQTATKSASIIKNKTADIDINLWKKDPSLKKIGSSLTSCTHCLLSLDFFDTFFLRLCNDPKDLFTEVADRIRKAALFKTDITATEFKEIRAEAESRCRLSNFWTKKSNETTIKEIYERLSVHVIKNPEKCVQIEVDVEKEWCFVNPMVLSLVAFAKSRGIKVCVISDMYLSSEHLRQICKHNGISPSYIDHFVTSCEYGYSKSSGNLFLLVLKQLNFKPNDMHHLGDNHEADINGGKHARINTYLYHRATEKTQYIFDVEKRFNESTNNTTGQNSIRTLAARTVTTQGRRYGAFLLGPVLSNWADWCVKSLKKDGIKKVLTFMREGELLAKLLKNSARAQNVSLEIETAYVSRQATHLASVGEATLESVPNRMYARTVGEILESFGLLKGEIGYDPAIASQKVESVEMLTTIVKYLTKGQIKAHIEEKSRNSRLLFLKYFLPLIKDHKSIGVVDLGWGATIQRNIAHIFKLENIPVKLYGYYLATTRTASIIPMEGNNIKGYLSSFGNRQPFTNMLIRSPEILEQSVSACVGSTIGYKEDKTANRAVPVLKNITATSKEQQKRKKIQEGILHYQKTWLTIAIFKGFFKNDNNPEAKQIEKILRDQSRAVIHRLIGYPVKEEAIYFGKFNHDDWLYSDANSLIRNPLATIKMENKGYFYIEKHGKNYWPEASLAVRFPDMMKQMTAGTELPVYLDRLGKDELPDKGNYIPKIKSTDIEQCRFDLDDWTSYKLKIRCPVCNNLIKTKLTGTFLVVKKTGCSKCHFVFELTYDEIKKYLQEQHPLLTGEKVYKPSEKLISLSEEINLSHFKDNDIPLLAAITNESTIGYISNLVMQKLNSKDN
jgi:predicted HAD superfamily hydrolase